MAAFCKQCSIETFGRDCGDLSGISSETDTEDKLYAVVLCEGCGPTQVNHTGECIGINCLDKSHKID